MSHREREHADGSAERGNDWLDGALAGWLLFIAINGGTLAWRSLHDGADWRTSARTGAACPDAMGRAGPNPGSILTVRGPGWSCPLRECNQICVDATWPEMAGSRPSPNMT